MNPDLNDNLRIRERAGNGFDGDSKGFQSRRRTVNISVGIVARKPLC